MCWTAAGAGSVTTLGCSAVAIAAMTAHSSQAACADFVSGDESDRLVTPLEAAAASAVACDNQCSVASRWESNNNNASRPCAKSARHRGRFGKRWFEGEGERFMRSAIVARERRCVQIARAPVGYSRRSRVSALKARPGGIAQAGVGALPTHRGLARSRL